MRILFFASGVFADPSFEAVIDAGHNVAALVIDPVAEKGGGAEVTAGAWRLPVLQPPEVSRRETLAELGQLEAEVQVVVGYRQAIPRAMLKAPHHGTVKLHPSLLPRYRGAAPVPWSILNGDSETGVTTFLMDGGEDSGPILLARSTPVGAEERAGELEARLAKLGAQALIDTLSGLEERSLKPKAQGKSRACDAPPIEEEEGQLDWTRDAQTLARQIRAFHPWPGSTTLFEGQDLKLLRASPTEPRSGEPGTVLSADFDGIVVACGRGTCLRLTQLQPDNLRPMTPSAFISRFLLTAGARFG